MQALKVAIDLGSDKIKVAFAYKDGENTVYGKLADKNVTGSLVTPAIAYYDEDNHKWLFGNDVYRGTDRPFITVVKIKTLLSLLARQKDKDITASNRKFYSESYDFPKFYFPVIKKISANFQEAVEMDMTFKGDVTPKKVCESFFVYLAQNIVKPAIEKLKTAKNIESFDKIDYSLVYPSKAGKNMIDELKRLIKYAFGKEPATVLSATKALGLYAYHRGALKKNEQLVIVDMGEEDISVAKLSLSADGNTVFVDGMDGHNLPIEIGGNDIDYAVRDLIESRLSGRETLGVSDKNGDVIAERGLHSKQFLMLTEIKNAKVALSLPDALYDNIFKDKVPLSIQREVTIQQDITREEFCKCIGIANGDKIAGKIADYIISELNRPVNDKVTKIALSGGVVETYGLVKFIKNSLKQNGFEKIEVITFDDFCNDDDGFNILSYEDSAFAPAVGGAIVALMNYSIKTAASLSYGTWQGRKMSGKKEKVLDIFLEKGQVLPSKGDYYYADSLITDEKRWEKTVENDELFSTTALRGRTIFIGEPNSELRRKLEKEINLKTVAGGKGKGRICFYKQLSDGSLQQIEIWGRLHFKEGIKVDGDGRAVPVLKNDLDKNGANNNIKTRPFGSNGIGEYTQYKDIILKFDGVDEFDVEGGD